MIKVFSQRRLFFVLRALVSVILVIYLIKIVDWPRVGEVFESARPYLSLLAVPISLVAIFCMAVRWHLLLSAQNVEIAIGRLYGYYLIGNCFNIFLPGVIGGDVVRIGYGANQYRNRLGAITGVAIFERVCGLIALFIMGGAVSYLVNPAIVVQLGVNLVHLFRLTALILVTLFAGGWILVRRSSDRLKTSGNPIATRLETIRATIVKLRFTTLLIALALSATAQALDLLAAFVLARTLGLDLALGLFFIVIPMTYLVTLLPISLGVLVFAKGY